MKLTIETKIFTPYVHILGTKHLSPNTVKEIFENCLTELQKTPFCWEIEGMTIPLHISYRKAKAAKKHIQLHHGTLTFSFEIDWNTYLEQMKKNYPNDILPEEKDLQEEVQLHFLCASLLKRYQEFIFTVNLAYPGFLLTQKAFLKKEKKVLSSIDGLKGSIFSESYFDQFEYGYSIIQILPIQDCWQWIETQTNFLNGMGELPIDRALNALTYLLNPDGYDEIFYALIGLEAIYTADKSTSVLEQLRRKIELLFGPLAGLKKKVTTMYDIRSQLMHGTLPFPSKYYIYDASEVYNQFFTNHYERTTNIAVLLLIGSVQQFIMHDAKELKSHFSLSFTP